MDQDSEHLQLLSIFHYIVAGIGALFSCFPVFHLTFGLVMLFAPSAFENGQHGQQNDAEVLRLVGIGMTAVATTIILVGWTISFCVFLAGRYLGRRRHYVFCLVIAAILCMMMPFGTVLGVFTIIVLMRPSVKAMFSQPTAEPLPS
jgi:hypothetical protein